MSIFDSLKEFFDDHETLIQKNSNKLDGYDVEGIDEFKALLEELLNDNLFERLNNAMLDFYNITNNEFKKNNFVPSKIPFFNKAKNKLGGAIIPFHFSSIVFASYNCLRGLAFLIEFNYFRHNNDQSPLNLYKKCYGGDFIPNLTKNVELCAERRFQKYDYDNLLIKIRKVNYQNKNVKKFHSLVIDNMCYPTLFIPNSNELLNSIKYSGYYLAACSAVKNSRNVTNEDIVIAYNLVLKILMKDLTKYIERDYFEPKVDKYDVFKKIK